MDSSGHAITENCTMDQVCSTNDFISYSIKESSVSLENWILQIGLQCSHSRYVGLIGSFSFVGSAIACITLPYLSDQIGRQPIFFAVQFVQIPVFIIAVYARTIDAIYIVSFFMGVLLVGKMTVGFVLFMELLPERNKVSKGILVMAGFPIAMLLSTFILVFCTRNVLILL
jgi:MFS family permease